MGSPPPPQPPPPALDSGIILIFSDSPYLFGATISITSGFVSSEDILKFTNQNGIIGIYNSSTGVLTLTGTATVAYYQAALRSITYTNSSNNPSITTRTISFVINDGIADSTPVTRNIDIKAVNDPPVAISTNSVVEYIENTTTAIDSGIILSNVDSLNLSGATVSISSGFKYSEDILNFTNQNGITGSYNRGTGVLTLIGTATIANYQTALQSITYANSSDNPTLITRTISFVVNNGAANSTAVTRNINITAVNDAPIAIVTNSAVAYSENATTAIDPGIILTDDSLNLVSATVSISSGFKSSEDTLNFTNKNGISSSYNSSTGVLTLTGTATVADYQTALQSITYTNSSDNPSTATRTISFVVDDGVANSITATRNLNLTAINDAPIATVTKSALAYTTKNAATAIDSGIILSDVDSANLVSATVKIASGFVSSEDTLNFTNQNGISSSYTKSTGVLTLTGTATVADYQTALRSVTYSNSSDNPSSVSRTISFVVNDGVANSTAVTRNLNTTAVNNPPIATVNSSAVAYSENATTAIDSGIILTDADSPYLFGATIKISSG
nr:hypothetical protein [Nostoc sp. DedSLP05]